MKRQVLFIGTHNDARTQIAEDYLRARFGDRYEVHSAGSAPTALYPFAVRTMTEIDVDITGQQAKDLGVFDEQEMDFVVALCGGGVCPMFPWANEILHADFADPAKASGSEDAVLAAYRKARDEIAAWIDETFGRRE
jgi:arsenate reductase (thioredoxin)